MPLVHFATKQDQVPADAINVRSTTAYASAGAPEVWLWDTHVGLCLREGEYNGRDDSDFYMIVWSPELGRPEQITFASTRGWSYPSYGSRADATPEVQAAYEAWQAAREAERQAELAWARSVAPEKGRTVRVVGGRKLPMGTEARVFWATLTHLPYMNSAGQVVPARGRIGLELPDRRRVFVEAHQVDVVL